MMSDVNKRARIQQAIHETILAMDAVGPSKTIPRAMELIDQAKALVEEHFDEIIHADAA